MVCVRYLLTEDYYFFVLTRNFKSDPIESLFGSLRMTFGCNDMLNVRAALSVFEKLLKTVIVASNAASNIAHKECIAMSGPVLADTLSSAQLASASAPKPPLRSTVQAVPQLPSARLVLQTSY